MSLREEVHSSEDMPPQEECPFRLIEDRRCRGMGSRCEATSDQTPARVNVTWVTPLGEEVVSTR
jgi:hypothetical protein